MKHYYKKWCAVTGVTMLLAVSLLPSGCGKKQIGEEEIKASKTYEDLDNKYQVLRRKYDKLKESSKQQTTEQQLDQKTAECFQKWKHSVFVKVRYEKLSEPQESQISDNTSLCKWLKQGISSADEVAALNADEFTSDNEARYHYILYNEDQSVTEFNVYDKDYVIFSELPDTVYQIPEILRLGRCCFASNGKEGKPQQSVFADMYDSELVYAQDKLLDISKGKKAASMIYQMKRKKLSEKPFEIEMEPQQEYVFWYEGQRYIVQIYYNYMSVAIGEETDWYKVDKDLAEGLKEALK